MNLKIFDVLTMGMPIGPRPPSFLGVFIQAKWEYYIIEKKGGSQVHFIHSSTKEGMILVVPYYPQR